MKITAVAAVVVGAGMRNWVFTKVRTDEGLTGWGEATTEFRTHSVVGALRDVEPLLLGQDPYRIEHLWQTMYRSQFWRGGLVSMSALSSVDQALHDIKAQALGVPLYELMGGRVRDSLRLYDHLGGGNADAVYGELDPTRIAEAAVQSVEQGFGAVKLLPVPVSGFLADRAALRTTKRVMAAVRDAIGPDIDLMVDLHGRCSPSAAVAFGRVLDEFDPWFIEEPCHADLVTELSQVAQAVRTPLAVGERLTTLSEFEAVLATGAVSIVQPDICHAGGPTQLKRIATVAALHGAGIAPHNPLGPIATMHNLHFAACTPNWIVQEQMRSAVAWFDDVVTSPLAVKDGHASIPSGPGLGIAVDEKVAAQHPPESDAQVAWAHLRDGSVADW